MPKLPAISDAEWEVMQVLWERWPRTASEVVAALAGRRRWNPRTVGTFLNRLVRKGALAFDVAGKRYLYRPAISRDQCIHRESRSFLSRVFGGAQGAMLVQ